MRLRRSDLQKSGFGRRRGSKGFRDLENERKPLTDKAGVARLKALVLPPA